ncbi:MAG TPA: hemolysin family protein [Longimicrobiales bacterium]|nr:hemolysin family protein [Longimicrobiales bacterium]
MSVVTFVILAVLIAFNGLYVAAEFAAVSVRRSRIRQMAEEGNRLARNLLPTLQDAARLDRYIAACQVGITVSSLVLGAYGQASLGEELIPLFERWGDMQNVAAQSASAAVVLVVLTTFQMILGELVPKSLALQYPTRLAVLTVLPMRWSEKLLSWFIVILNGSGWLVLRAIGVEPKAHRHLHSAEEIKFLVAESRKGGHLRAEEQRRLSYALGLTQRTARELMVPRTRMAALDAAAGMAAAVEAAATLPYTRLPVYRGSMDDIVGLVHTKDLAAATLSDRAGPGDPLTPYIRPILAVHESLSADRVLSLMREERGIMAVVVDDFGGTAGIITTEDILSELLGDVADEFKQPGGGAERLPDGRIRLPGAMLLHEASTWVETPWQGDADTVGGLVMERLGRIPAAGDRLDIDGVEVEVEAVERHAVDTVLARPPADEEGA